MKKSRDDILVEYFDFYMYYTFTNPGAAKREFGLPCPTSVSCSGGGCWSLFPRLYTEYWSSSTVPYDTSCPCFKLGVKEAMKELEKLLRREGFIDAK